MEHCGWAGVWGGTHPAQGAARLHIAQGAACLHRTSIEHSQGATGLHRAHVASIARSWPGQDAAERMHVNCVLARRHA
eukprot:1150346-Pelagomonas_calceolata.AAC.3